MKLGSDPGVPPIIILAGGHASRFGSAKGLALFEGRTLLAAHLDSSQQIGSLAIVVTGVHHDVYEAEVASVCSASGVRAVCVRNPYPDRGPFSSLQVGLLAAPDVSAGAFVQPVDAGPVDGGFYQSLYEHSEMGRCAVVPLAQGTGGHPVFLSPQLLTRCVALDPLSPEARLDILLRQLQSDEVRRVEFGDARIHRNFNSPADLEFSR